MTAVIQRMLSEHFLYAGLALWGCECVEDSLPALQELCEDTRAQTELTSLGGTEITPLGLQCAPRFRNRKGH